MNEVTARVTIDGLGICLFNKSTLRWEVRFPREPRHDLTLRIYKNQTLHREPDIRNAGKISIYTVLGDYWDYKEKYKGGCIDKGKVDRKTEPTPENRNNMRWAINLSDEQDVPPGYKGLQTPPYGNTVLEITNSLFYVEEISTTELLRAKVGDNPNDHTVARHYFGRTSGLIGAKICCEPDTEHSGVYINIDGKEHYYLPAEKGVVYRIKFVNMEPAKYPQKVRMFETTDGDTSKDEEPLVPKLYKGDYDVYYDSMKEARERWALWGLPITAKGSRTDCDAVWIEDPEP